MSALKKKLEEKQDLQIVMEGFMKEADNLLKSAGLNMPLEDVPAVEYSDNLTSCYNPAIGLRNFNPRIHYGCLIALGRYEPADDNPTDRKFILFFKNIIDVATLYTINSQSINKNHKAFNKHLTVNVSLITAHILCHLVSHWLLHRSICANGKTMGKRNYQKIDQICYHEGLAQALVFTAYENLADFIPNEWLGISDLNEIMYWMDGNQPYQYSAYKSLLVKSDKSQFLKAMVFLRQTNIQSFELLEQTIKLYANDGEPTLEKLFELFYNKPITPLLQKEVWEDVAAYIKLNLPESLHQFRGRIFGKSYGLN
jgi:hypothetical protein